MMGLEPVFLLADVPGEVAYAIGVAGGTAILTLWRRNVFLEDRSRADRIEALNAIHVGTQAVAGFVSEWRLWREEWHAWMAEESARRRAPARDESSA